MAAVVLSQAGRILQGAGQIVAGKRFPYVCGYRRGGKIRYNARLLFMVSGQQRGLSAVRDSRNRARVPRQATSD